MNDTGPPFGGFFCALIPKKLQGKGKMNDGQDRDFGGRAACWISSVCGDLEPDAGDEHAALSYPDGQLAGRGVGARQDAAFADGVSRGREVQHSRAVCGVAFVSQGGFAAPCAGSGFWAGEEDGAQCEAHYRAPSTDQGAKA